MAQKASKLPQLIFSSATRMISSFSPKIPLCTTSTSRHNQLYSALQPCIIVPDAGSTKGNARMMSDFPTREIITNDSEKERNSLDHMVNSYPAARRFIAIGSGGDDFADAMVFAVESVLREPIPDASVRKRVSSMGRYISVNIGPVQVISREQVKAVYETMMKDARMRYFF